MAVVILLFVIATAFLVIALVGPYRLYWQARPHAARQPSDGALAVGRVVAFGVAGVLAFGGCQAQTSIDKGTWSASEVREAAEDAAESMAADTQIRTQRLAECLTDDALRAADRRGMRLPACGA